MTPCGFTIKHYLETINLYRDNGYHIGPVGDYFHNDVYHKHILLRHDVDLSLDYALEMALLEKDNDIHATYFILVTSDLYSAVSPKGRERIKAIKDAGHEIALHVDSRYYMGTCEFTVLSEIAETTISTWARHLVNLTPELDIPRDAATIPNYKYLSDSAMNWREGCWCNHIGEYDKMQILIHPEWTMTSPAGKRNKFEIIEDLKQEAKGNVSDNFRQFRELVEEYYRPLLCDI